MPVDPPAVHRVHPGAAGWRPGHRRPPAVLRGQHPAHALTAALQATTPLQGAVTWVLVRRAGVRGRLLAETVAVALLGVVMILLEVALH